MGKEHKRVTIYDIAKRVNVSPSTISRVLSNSNYPVSEKLREKILKAADEMNYYPNLSARSLKKQDSRNIGIVLPSISNPFYPSVVKGIEDVAYKNNYTLFICSSDSIKDREKNYIKLLMQNFVRGIITIFIDPVTEEINEYIEQGGKVLSIYTKKLFKPKAHVFYFDRYHEGYAATKHLIDLGHKKIAFLTPPLINTIRQDRIQGYKKALEEAGIKDTYIYLDSQHDNIDYLDNVYDCKIGVDLTNRLLRENPEITGIICMNDIIALACISTLQENGYNVPADYSVIGFDDLFFSNLVNPKLTTMRFEKYKVGKLAMETLIEIMEEKRDVEQVDLSSYLHLVVRESSSKPR